ncbi:MAG: hypothetical protein AVDCRST_MAG77-4969 [uncultured Chloroflexi bacterium]|uniref:Uncharacterized protein n=1 Tax=uncultured Chloroflexota bacterium TaxID=166587 RepID=A0A6J4K1V1_9CHLR|nr:MAG: hypothetical protein AVDCRST_MAG77-4969 [uncultured Chloroflexota bacterium]
MTAAPPHVGGVSLRTAWARDASAARHQASAVRAAQEYHDRRRRGEDAVEIRPDVWAKLEAVLAAPGPFLERAAQVLRETEPGWSARDAVSRPPPKQPAPAKARPVQKREPRQQRTSGAPLVHAQGDGFAARVVVGKTAEGRRRWMTAFGPNREEAIARLEAKRDAPAVERRGPQPSVRPHHNGPGFLARLGVSAGPGLPRKWVTAYAATPEEALARLEAKLVQA